MADQYGQGDRPSRGATPFGAALMETADKPYYVHPLFWAPFVAVGEGATP